MKQKSKETAHMMGITRLIESRPNKTAKGMTFTWARTKLKHDPKYPKSKLSEEANRLGVIGTLEKSVSLINHISKMEMKEHPRDKGYFKKVYTLSKTGLMRLENARKRRRERLMAEGDRIFSEGKALLDEYKKSEFLQVSGSIGRISSGNKHMDKMMEGGIPSGYLTAFFGVEQPLQHKNIPHWEKLKLFSELMQQVIGERPTPAGLPDDPTYDIKVSMDVVRFGGVIARLMRDTVRKHTERVEEVNGGGLSNELNVMFEKAEEAGLIPRIRSKVVLDNTEGLTIEFYYSSDTK